MVYRIITAILTRSRTASKTQLFHDVTYIFTGWVQHEVPTNQRSLSIKWEKAMTHDMAFIEDLPRTSLINPNDRQLDSSHEFEKINLDNRVHLETLISQHPELSLVIEHDVMVDGTSRRLRYAVNLIEVVCRSMASYVTLDSAAKSKDALCVDKRCLKVLTVLAIGLRRLMEKAVADLQTKESVVWANNKCTKVKRGRRKRNVTNHPSAENEDSTNSTANNYKFEAVYGMSLDNLFPAPTTQKHLLTNMILSMTVEEFNAKSIDTACGRATRWNDNDGLGVNANEGTRIRADETEGVFRF